MNRRALILCLVPIAWLGLSVAAERATGPYSPFDPDYYYLLSSLDLAEFRTVGTYHHPGTTVQTFGAAVIWMVYWWSGESGGIQQSVLRHPEFYLQVIHYAISGVVALGLLTLGAATARAANLWLGVLLQLSVFLTPVIAAETIGRFQPEPFLVVAGLLFTALMVMFSRGDPTGSPRLATAFGVVCGFGMATKFTFVPVAVVPLLLLTDRKSRVRFGLSGMAAFVLFTLPIANSYAKLIGWTANVASHKGIYGGGEPGIVDPAAYLHGFQLLFALNPFLDVVIALAVLTIIFATVSAYRPRRSWPTGREFTALCATVASLSLAFIVVAKYASFGNVSRYLVGPYCLMGLTVWLSAEVLCRFEFAKSRTVRWAIFAVFLLPAVARLATVPTEFANQLRVRADARDRYLARDAELTALDTEAYSDFARIYDTGVRSPVHALMQATFYSTQQVEGLVAAYPSVFFCVTTCTAANWTTTQMISVDASKAYSAAEIVEKFNGRVVLVSGTPPTVQAVRLEE